MAQVADVAAYILAKTGPTTAMKIHRLAYFAYGYHLAWEDRELFPEPFEAWANGPVVADLYAMHCGMFALEPGSIPGDPAALDDGEAESVGAVLDAYGAWSAHELSLLTHDEPPWLLARARSGAGPLERSHERLRRDEIAEHFEGW